MLLLLYKKIIKKVKMAGDCGLNALSLLPENVLPQWQQKIANAENTANPYCRGPYGFSARSAIFCRYWTCTFSCSLRNATLSAFEEGAPFMGTALAEYEQCIGAEVVCIFTYLSIFLYRRLSLHYLDSFIFIIFMQNTKILLYKFVCYIKNMYLCAIIFAIRTSKELYQQRTIHILQY